MSVADDLFLGRCMTRHGTGWYTNSDEALQTASAIEAAKILRMIVAGEYELGSAHDKSAADWDPA